MEEILKIRASHVEDLPEIMEIISMAVAYMKENHIAQWSDTYPDAARILKDMEAAESYVCLAGERIIGTGVLSLREEPNYARIDGGSWENNGPYGVIHRLAVDNDFKGHSVAAAFVDHLEKMCINKNIYSVRVDTHRDNVSMRRFLEKHGFLCRGTIYVEDGTPRTAYEKKLENKTDTKREDWKNEGNTDQL
ncbi:MAG TPA: GNAT family N-acetyltransferase [Candidatus Scybalocola faecavium]|nr:GNAT family N-acetyltransferase [Candidatus Scybalocola faecavium]